jgi:hypothetical protein
VKLKLKDMGFLRIRVHMMQGCVSVGIIPKKACHQGKRVSSFLFFYPLIPSKYYGEKQKNMRWGILLFQTPYTGGQNIMVTYRLITLKTKQIILEALVQGRRNIDTSYMA